MDEDETQARAEPGQSCRALVVRAASQDAERQRPGDGGFSRRVSGGRPMAGFLAQLISAADPTLRPPRTERTRAAARLYARAARLA